MTQPTPHPTRRQFLSLAAASAAAAALGPARRTLAQGTTMPTKPARKTILSFYVDDTSPYIAGAKAFQTFLDYCAEQKIAGESSAILGAGENSMARKPTDEEQAFLKQVARAWDCGVGTHMEVMTHGGLFDFDANRTPTGAQHEGVWLHEPDVAAKTYESYFASILAEGERAGIKFTGFTWPGCGCDPCKKRYAELRAAKHTEPNLAMWQALLNLAKQGKFRGPTVPCFFGSSETDFGARRKAADGQYGVYDLIPNAMDHFGIWENNPKHVDADYYITAGGKGGIIPRHLQAGDPYCLWYSHWQGLNPAKGLGWKAFTTVIERISKHMQDRVVWMRPSDITDRYHKAGGWGFLEGM